MQRHVSYPKKEAGMKSKLFLALCFFCIAINSFAQIEDQRRSALPALNPDIDFNSPTSPNRFSKTISDDFIRIDPVQSWKTVNNPNPEINIDLSGTGEYAGDINGDGKNDIIFSDIVQDERTSDLSDQTGKTLVFFGGNFSALEYDQIIYEMLTPVGDMNGDGYDDAVTRSRPDVAEVYLGSPAGYVPSGASVSPLTIDSRIVGFDDLDGDGFEDYISWLILDDKYEITWGASKLNGIETQPYSLPTRDNRLLNTADLDSSGKAEFVLVTQSTTSTKITTIEIFSFDSNREPVLRQLIEHDRMNGFLTPSLIDIDGDGFLEMLIAKRRFNKDTTGENLYNSSSIELSRTTDFYPIGDLNSDRRHDFILYRPLDRPHVNPVIYFLYYSGHQEISFGPNEDGDVTFNVYGGYGDLDGDGIDDAIVPFKNSVDRVFGRYVLHGNDEFYRPFLTTKVVYNASEFVGNCNATANLGDLNRDGVDDFGFIHRDRNNVSVFFGKSSLSDTPDLILEGEGGETPFNAIAGDFNGDGWRDVAVTFVEGDRRIQIYYGSETFDGQTDVAIREIHLFFGDPSFGLLMMNAGDINHDGFDDLIVAPSSVVRTAFIFLGGPSFSSTPDYQIDYSQEGVIASMAALGDINADGIDDFALGVEEATNDNGTTGKVFIHYGIDQMSGALSDLLSPDLVLSPDNTSGESILYFGASIAGRGDFNADGFMDIAIKPFVFTDGCELAGCEGSAAVYVYNGGREIDAQVDKLLFASAEMLNDTMATGMYSTINTGELTFVADLDRDGSNELLLTAGLQSRYNRSVTNSVIYLGGANPSAQSTLVLMAPNQRFALGGDSFPFAGDPHSAVGDFNNNGIPDIILSQISDNNDAASSSRVYRYEISPEMIVSVAQTSEQKPRQFSLKQNYPNPFNPETTIRYQLAEPGLVRLEIFNLRGQQIRTLVNERRSAGAYSVKWDGRDDSGRSVASGVFLYRLNAGESTESRKLVLIR
jgi:hypothetical protein